MPITITIGWWLIPAVVTMLSFGRAIGGFSRNGGDYSFPEIFNGILLLVAAIPSLIAWLVWALLT